MQITDEILISLGANPLIYGEAEKERIAGYIARAEAGVETADMFPSTEILDSECVSLKNFHKNCKLELRKFLLDLDQKANEMYNICEDRANMFGEPKNEEAHDELMLFSSWRIQEADVFVNKSLDTVADIYAVFLRLSDILNEYRLLFLESNLVYLAEQITNRTSGAYENVTKEINSSMEICHALAFECYEYAHGQELIIEQELQRQMNSLSDAMRFNADGKDIKVNEVLEQIRRLRQIISKAINYNTKQEKGEIV